MNNEVLILVTALLLIIMAVLASRVKTNKKTRIVGIILAVVIIVLGVIWRSTQGGF